MRTVVVTRHALLELLVGEMGDQFREDESAGVHPPLLLNACWLAWPWIPVATCGRNVGALFRDGGQFRGKEQLGKRIRRSNRMRWTLPPLAGWSSSVSWAETDLAPCGMIAGCSFSFPAAPRPIPFHDRKVFATIQRPSVPCYCWPHGTTGFNTRAVRRPKWRRTAR